MSVILLDKGAEAMLASYFRKENPGAGNNLTLRLFVNDITVDSSSIASSFTEASGGGYAAITLTPANWTVSATNDPRDASYPMQTFTFTGALASSATIYGYYITDAAGVAVYAEKAQGTYQPSTNGDTYKVTPKFQLSYGTPAA